MTDLDEKELESSLNMVLSMAQSAKLAFDGAKRTGGLADTQHFAEQLHIASGLFLELVDMIVEGK